MLGGASELMYLCSVPERKLTRSSSERASENGQANKYRREVDSGRSSGSGSGSGSSSSAGSSSSGSSSSIGSTTAPVSAAARYLKQLSLSPELCGDLYQQARSMGMPSSLAPYCHGYHRASDMTSPLQATAAAAAPLLGEWNAGVVTELIRDLEGSVFKRVQ